MSTTQYPYYLDPSYLNTNYLNSNANSNAAWLWFLVLLVLLFLCFLSLFSQPMQPKMVVVRPNDESLQELTEARMANGDAMGYSYL